MASQKGIFIFSLIVLMLLRVVRGDPSKAKEHVYLTERGISDSIDYDAEADEDLVLNGLPIEDTIVDALNASQTPDEFEERLPENFYESLNSPAAVDHLAYEYLRIIENEIASLTIKEVLKKTKLTLTEKSSMRSILRLATEISHFMTQPRSPENVRRYLQNRLNYYTHLATPGLIGQKFEKIESFVNNENIPKHLNFINDAIVNFIKKPDVTKVMAKSIVLINRLLHKEIPAFLLG